MHTTPAKKKKSVFVYLSVLLAGVALPVYAYAQSTCEQCFSDCETVWIFTTQSCSTYQGEQRMQCEMNAGFAYTECMEDCTVSPACAD